MRTHIIVDYSCSLICLHNLLITESKPLTNNGSTLDSHGSLSFRYSHSFISGLSDTVATPMRMLKDISITRVKASLDGSVALELLCLGM